MRRKKELKTEHDVQQAIQIEGPFQGAVLQRNNSGALLDKDGREVRFGLGNISKEHNRTIKSPDLIGITQVTVTKAMVGKKIAVFTGCEVKEPGWSFSENNDHELAQDNYLNWVRLMGGIGFFAQSIKDFRDAIANYVNDLKK